MTVVNVTKMKGLYWQLSYVVTHSDGWIFKIITLMFGGMVGGWEENNLFLWSFNFSCGINQFSGLLMTELMVNGMTNGWDCGATGRGENLL